MSSRMGDDAVAFTSTRLRGAPLPTPITVTVQELWGRGDVGLMVTPAGGVKRTLGRVPFWAADTGCFAQPAAFDEDAYLRWLETLGAHRGTCLFATAPDRVGDWGATWQVARPVLPRIRAAGYPAALVAQDGMTELPAPDEWDVLFVGGSTAWKLSERAFRLAREAKALGKTTHMGRCNSWPRLRVAAQAGYHSADGTQLRFNPGAHGKEIIGWMERLKQQPGLPLWG